MSWPSCPPREYSSYRTEQMNALTTVHSSRTRVEQLRPSVPSNSFSEGASLESWFLLGTSRHSPGFHWQRQTRLSSALLSFTYSPARL